MRSFFEFPIRRPGWVVLIAFLATAFFVTRIVDPVSRELSLKIDPSFDAILPDDAYARVFYDWTQEEFGDDQSLIIGLTLDDVFTVEHLQLIERISDKLEELPGVDYVTSLATADHIQSVGDEVDIRPFLDPTPQLAADAVRIRNALEGNPVYAGNLVSADARSTAFIVYVDDTPEQTFTDEGLDLGMLAAVEEEVAEVPGAEVFMSGTAQMRSATSRVLRGDLAFMLPAVLGLMALIAALSFRSPRGVGVPILTILLATIWTLGVMAWASIPINLVTTTVPVLMLTVGFAYSVHVVADYFKAFRTDIVEVESAGGPAAWALKHVALPVSLTCITTVAGFLSLTISGFPAVREFGFVSVFGVVATTLLSLTLSPAVLQLLGPTARQRAALEMKAGQLGVSGEIGGPDGPEGGEVGEVAADSHRFDRWVERLGSFCLDHRRGILIAAGGIALLTLAGITQIRVDTHMITNFAEDHPTRMHFDAISDRLEGARPFSVVLKGAEDEAFLEPENLRVLDEFKAWLIAQPEIGGATSFADYVKLLNRAFHEGRSEYLTIPDDALLVKQYLLFSETEELEDYVASGYQNTLIRVRSKSETTREIADLVARIEKRMEELPAHIEAGVTGNTVVLAQSIDAIASGQVQSLSIAMLFIYVLLSILFASPRMGFIGLVPNVLPVLVFFGVLGLSGVPLNANTGLIACVVLGIAVDDTIHFMTRFNVEAREAADERVGALRALRGLARPVTITTIGLVLGFLVFTTGALRNQAEFGALAALVLAFAWLVDVTFTPALCSGLRVVTLWDVLTYDLGEEPQKTIPMFAGLSKTQARIAALMTDVVKVPAGERLFNAGDEGDAVYVVIDGQVSVSGQSHEGEAVEFERVGRGHVVGEVGLYHGKRTADVSVTEDVRALRLDSHNLKRLSKRYPWIATRVFWNLSEAMANRLAKATDRENALAGRLRQLDRSVAPE
ncbi:MAG: MMPL family transporter [Myxococcota bacterium]